MYVQTFSETPVPNNLTATYKLSNTSVLLEWIFPESPSTAEIMWSTISLEDNVSFRGSLTTHQLNDIPARGIHSISLVAMRPTFKLQSYLPSPVAGPVDPGVFWIFVNVY